MKNEVQIRALLERYDEGLTSQQEERRLYELLTSEEELPNELRVVAAMLGGFAELREEQLPRRLTAAPHRKKMRWMGWVAAAVAAVGICLLADRAVQPYCYINGVAVYDTESAIASTACLAHLEHLDRSMELFDDLLLTTKKE